MQQKDFTKYEMARILGARALQIAMDAPILLKMSEENLNKINYDALAIAERELEEGVLPIVIHRPLPKRKKDKLEEIREEKIDDEELIAKEKEVEKEIAEKAEELGFVEEDDEGFGEETVEKEE